MTDTAKVLAAIETVWDDFRVHRPELPAVVVGIDMRGRKHALDYREATVTDDHVPPLLEVPLPCVRQGGRAVVEHLLHVATHCLCDVRGVSATTNRGRRHNGKFASVARDMGCEWPDGRSPDPVMGYAPVPVTAAMWADMAPYVTVIDRVLDRSRAVAELEEAAKRTAGSGTRLSMGCGCGRTIQVGPRVAAMGPVICGVCHEEFRAR